MTRVQTTELRAWVTALILAAALFLALAPPFNTYRSLAAFGGESFFLDAAWPAVLMACLALGAVVTLLIRRAWSPVAFLAAAAIPPAATAAGMPGAGVTAFALPTCALAWSAWRLHLHVSSSLPTHEPEEFLHGPTQQEV